MAEIISEPIGLLNSKSSDCPSCVAIVFTVYLSDGIILIGESLFIFLQIQCLGEAWSSSSGHPKKIVHLYRPMSLAQFLSSRT